jgi:glycosyltransferase involved in cell wall biosynthesis
MNKNSDNFTIWILQTGEPLHIDEGNPRPMRAMNLSNALVESGHRVVLWSSAFYHQEKRQRTIKAETIVVSTNLEIRLITSPGYKRNIGLGRLWDHAVLAKNLSGLLKEVTEIPDIAFIGYPPIETAAVMGKWLTKKKVNYIVDVKDQWPSLFVEALPSPLRPIGKIALYPYFYLAKKCLKEAKGLVAMSPSFLEWASAFAGRKINQFDRIVPLTTPQNSILAEEFAHADKWWDDLGIKADGTPRFSFVGSHSRAFDMVPVMNAARYLFEKKVNCQFVICGDGPFSAKWKQMAKGVENMYFPGWIDRAKSESLGKRSLAALAPYLNVDNFILNIPNKIIDSLAQGLPILSPLRGEVRDLLLNKNVGISYGVDFNQTLEEAIILLINDSAFRNELSENAKALYQKEYSCSKVYNELVNHLELVAHETFNS